MSKSNSWETTLLQHLFQNANVANIGDATGLRGSTTAGNLYFSLHTADPTEPGNQSTNEVAYGAYARIAVVRSAGGFTVTGNIVSPAANVVFPQCTSGTATITHFGIGTDPSGTGTLLYSGTVSPNIAIAVGVQPILTTSSAVTED